MANRSIQAKILKMKRRNRKKRFSTERLKVHSRGPGFQALTQYSRNQIEPPDPFLEVLFPPKIYTPEEMRQHEAKPGIRSVNDWPRAEAIRRYYEMIQEIDEDKRVIIFDATLRKVWLYFNTAKGICFLIEFDYRLLKMKKSFSYPSPIRAKECFQKKQIQWCEPIDMVPTVPQGVSPSAP
jgi:hypothetical protein